MESVIGIPGFDISLLWVVLKWAYVLVAILFVGFGVVMLSQVKQMVATIKRPFNKVIVTASLGFFGATVIVLLMTLGVL
jgi:hypothetical protein